MRKKKKEELKPSRAFSNQALLEQFINNFSPVGMEARLYKGATSNQRIWLDNIRPYVDTIEHDKYGNVWATINPNAKFTVVIAAHADQIGWSINYIDEEGNITVIRRGGSDAKVFGGDRGYIINEKGKFDVIAHSPAIHLQEAPDSPNSGFKLVPKNLYLTAGVNREELKKMGVSVGDAVVQAGEFKQVGKLFTGPAFDNRIGGFVLIEVARRLKELRIKPNFKLVILNTVKEEIGLKGATSFANRFGSSIDLAIPIDVCHSIDGYPHIVKNAEHGDTTMGRGPVITRGSITHPLVVNLMKEAAQKGKIPFQLDARDKMTGTDTDPFHDWGIPAGVISIPTADMHTPVENIHPYDVIWSVDLYVEIIRLLNNAKKRDFSLL